MGMSPPADAAGHPFRSFGQPERPVEEMVMQLPPMRVVVVPSVDPAALAELTARIRSAVADAVRAGFADAAGSDVALPPQLNGLLRD